ncbi:hypothetical protein FSPOR_5185 [Fusarium sporotrichioides]|uniref:Uncharacterized protein n=1 Tax=Fusarium sporotrichioides TaxID=5514 RepID=A0A395S8F5_FUSSP|nr:hypothetical protein FSPOR_5185 [Fusarium sporotrichioides]
MSFQRPARGSSPHPRIQLHTPEVDFIENRLQEYHPAFDVSKVRYDDNEGQFIAIDSASSQRLMVPDAAIPTRVRPAPAPVSDMEFWDKIFAIAMERFNNDAKVKLKRDPKWDIRRLSKWSEIQARLEEAQGEYNFNNRSKSIEKARRTMRSFLNNYHIIPQQIGKLVPSSEIAGPIVGVINLMVDAYSKASEVRDEVVSSLEGLPACFAKIDLYLGSFPQDDNVVKASTDLVLAVFEAVESSIKFYTSVQGQQAQAETMVWIQNLFNHAFLFLKDYESEISPPLLNFFANTGRADEMFQQDRGRAQQIVTMPLFHSWINSARSTKLLVHGDFRDTEYVSPLSTLCTVLALAFRQGGRFISLVFFCGRHLVWNDYHGGVVMIRSLIAQILRQFPSQYLNPDVHNFLQNTENIDSLCNLFRLLVSQIPARLPVVCLIDGINCYETDDYLDDMTTVVLSLVELVDTSSYGNSTCFKLLLTSPLPTREVRQVFDGDRDALLHMENVPLTGTNVGLNEFQEQLVNRV